MSVEFTNEAVQMLKAGGLVAACALPTAVVAWRVACLRRQQLLPQFRTLRGEWGGFEVFAAFVITTAFIPYVLGLFRLPPLVLGVAALPVQLVVLTLVDRLLHANPRVDRGLLHFSSGLIVVAVAAWAILTPVVLLFHALVLQLFELLELQTVDHPLAKFGAGAYWEQVLFIVQASVAAPVIEEVLFRGLLLTWALGAGIRKGSNQLPSALRPWVLIGVSVFFAASTGKPGPVVFAIVLGLGLAAVWLLVRRGKRHVRAVYATAALFAMVHAAVWPSPIPLFLLGLGLGWIAVRTGGVAAPALLHGLFNSVSVVFVLRGSPN